VLPRGQVEVIAKGSLGLVDGSEIPYEVREITLPRDENGQPLDLGVTQFGQPTVVEFETPSGESSQHPLALLLRSQSIEDRPLVV
jgi:hypothetical protein